MFNLQGSEIIVILLLALVVLGPEKLPEAIRRFTRTYAELKKMGSGFQTELKSALDEPMREMRETADLVRNAADPDQFAAEPDAEPNAPGEVPVNPPSDPDGGVLDPGSTVATPPPSATEAADTTTQTADSRPDDGHTATDEPAPSPSEDGTAPSDEPSAPVNLIAAGNSSRAIAATNGGTENDDETGGEPAKRTAPQPMFHSAAPRRVDAAEQATTGEPPADTEPAEEEADASPTSDEAATA